LRDDQLRDLSMETSEKSQNAKFAVTEFYEVQITREGCSPHAGTTVGWMVATHRPATAWVRRLYETRN
jgi:hypothetical protein